MAIPKGLAGSVGQLDTAPASGLRFEVFAQTWRTRPLRSHCALYFAPGKTVATLSGAGGLLASGDTVTIQVKTSSRPAFIGFSMALVDVHV